MKPARVGLQAPRWPFLFSTHLDTSRIRRGSTLVFSVRLVVTATDYEIDGFLSFDRTIPRGKPLSGYAVDPGHPRR